MSGRFNPATTLFPLMLVGLLAGLSYWLELASHPPENPNDGKLRHDPDFVVKHFVIRRFDPQGTLQHTLNADHMRHYPDDDSTTIQSPQLIYHRQPPTFISARAAQVDGKGEHVQLIGDVRITRTARNGKPDATLMTEQLDAFPDAEIARTNAPVTITQGRTHVTGTGLTTNSATGMHALGGPVRGIFYRGASNLARNPPPAPISSMVKSALPTKTAKPVGKPKTKPKPRPKSKPESKSKAKAKP